MVDEKKVHVMAQLALDETKHDKEELYGSLSHRADYVRTRVNAVLVSISVCTVLIYFLVALFYADYIFVHVADMNYRNLGLVLVGIYVLIMAVGGFFSHRFYARKYESLNFARREYSRKLDVLEGFYVQEGEETADDTVTGA